jgi:hypothetical protein
MGTRFGRVSFFNIVPDGSSAKPASRGHNVPVVLAARSLGIIFRAITLSLVIVSVAWAQSGANSDPTYVALRNIGLSSEAVQVQNFAFKRDAGTFRLNSGTICFVSPVNGKVTGAVFVGDGVFLLEPPTEAERKSLKFLTKEEEFSEKFERLVLRFTDSTYEEIKKAETARIRRATK